MIESSLVRKIEKAKSYAIQKDRVNQTSELICVYIRSFRHHAVNMRLPRTLVTRHPLGRTIGAPGDVASQRRVVGAALEMLSEASQPSQIVELEDAYALPTG